MITSSGAKCDVCGKFILPLDPNELVNTFSVAQIPGRELHCDKKCKRAIQDCGGDWQKLPDGPLREAYEEAAAKSSNGPADLPRTTGAEQPKALPIKRQRK